MMRKRDLIKSILGFTIVILLILGFYCFNIHNSWYSCSQELIDEKLKNDLLFQENIRLEDNNTDLQNTYDQLGFEYSNLSNQYDNLSKAYFILEGKIVPSTQINNGTIYFTFENLNNETIVWEIPISTYKYHIYPKLRPIFYNTINISGEEFYVLDINNFLTPDLFIGLIKDLVDGKRDDDFVHEVINFKNQMVTYGTFQPINCRWPIESLVDGLGDCEDLSVLIVSMLKAGNEIGNYDMQMSFIACDSQNLTNPNTVDHVIVYVQLKDGTHYYIEPTAKSFQTHESVIGWIY